MLIALASASSDTPTPPPENSLNDFSVSGLCNEIIKKLHEYVLPHSSSDFASLDISSKIFVILLVWFAISILLIYIAWLVYGREICQQCNSRPGTRQQSSSEPVNLQ